MALQIPAFTDDQSYPFWYLRKMMSTCATPGVVNPSTDFIVSPSSGLQVQCTSGAAFVLQTVNIEGSSAYNGLYLVINDGVTNPSNTIAAPISNPRIDQVILQVLDVKEQGSGSASKVQLLWLEGSENASASLTTMGPGKSNPGAATLPANSLLLAYVLQTVGESSISSGNIVSAGSVSTLNLTLPPDSVTVSELDAPTIVPTLVTAIPASPVDGQIIDFVADSTNGVIWRFRYRAASSSTYKWEFVGGSPLYGYFQTLQPATGTSYNAGSPSITLPTLPSGGDFDITISCGIMSGNTDYAVMSFSTNVAASDNDAIFGPYNTQGSGSITRRKTALPSGTTIETAYRNQNGGGGNSEFGNRALSIRPVRVG